MKLLQDLRALVPKGSVYLFPNRLDPERPMADRGLNALIERLAFSGDGTPHGMRATFSMHFNANGAGIDVIEHCLAHVPGDRVRGIQPICLSGRASHYAAGLGRPRGPPTHRPLGQQSVSHCAARKPQDAA